MVQQGHGKFAINVTRFLINYVVRFVFATIALYCSWLPLHDLNDWFSYHVMFCTIGLMPFVAEGLMLFFGDELWSRQLSRTEKYGVHGVLTTLGTFFLIVGNLPGIYFIKPGFHLYTVHGITGLLSMIILSLSVVLGLSVKYSNNMKKFFTVKPVKHKLIHNLIGLLGYAIGIVSLCFAYFTDWFVSNNGEISRVIALTVTILASLWSVHKALVSLYGQIKSVIT